MPQVSSEHWKEFIETCYTVLLNRGSDEAGRAHFLNRLQAGASPAEIIREFAASPEYMKEGEADHWVPLGHFYSPFPSREEVARHLSRPPAPDAMRAIDLCDDEQRRLMECFKGFYGGLPFSDAPTAKCRYGYVNSSYPPGDAIPLHSFIRYLQPKRIIEVGSGNSTCMILDTCEHFLGGAVDIALVEPYPEFLKTRIRPQDFKWAKLRESRLQDVPLSVFQALEPKDILFIDSTHVSKLESDVNFLFFELLPILKRGVFIHIHDVFYPFEYPTQWHEEGRAWNEQYVLRAFLQYNEAFKIRFFNTYLMQKHRQWFAENMPRCLEHQGGSIWLEKTQ